MYEFIVFYSPFQMTEPYHIDGRVNQERNNMLVLQEKSFHASSDTFLSLRLQTNIIYEHIIADCIQKSKSLLYKNFNHFTAKISKMCKARIQARKRTFCRSQDRHIWSDLKYTSPSV